MRAGRVGVAVAAGAALVIAMGGPAAAAKPSAADRLEKLTEQYNGLVVQLQRSRQAATVADQGAVKAQADYDAARKRIATLAADRYKNGGGFDAALSVASAPDPQAFLDQSASVSYLAKSSGAQAGALLNALQESVRAKKAAQDRLASVRTLSTQVAAQRKTLQATIAKSGITPAKATRTAVAIPAVAPGGASAKALGAVKAALAEVGTPYSWGGGTASGPSYGVDQGAHIKGFDCSGLTLYAYAQVGITLPHYTGDQWNAGTHVSKSALRPGDLVFFNAGLTHMGMYIGGGKVVHAPQTGDVVKVSPLSGFDYQGAVRVA